MKLVKREAGAIATVLSTLALVAIAGALVATVPQAEAKPEIKPTATCNAVHIVGSAVSDYNYDMRLDLVRCQHNDEVCYHEADGVMACFQRR